MRRNRAQRLITLCLRSPRAATVAAFACGASVALPLVMNESSAHAANEHVVRAAASAAALAIPQANAMETVDPVVMPASFVHPEIPTPAVSIIASKPGSGEVRLFNGRPLRAARTITMKVTAYSPDARSCGESADGITASGYSVFTNGGKLVAADTELLPLGSLVSVPGYDDDVVPVLDRGGAIKGKRLDVLFPRHEDAIRWGVKELEVTVWEYADGKPNDFRENHWKRAS